MAVESQCENMDLPSPMRVLRDWIVNPTPIVPSFEAALNLQQNAHSLASMVVSQPLDAQMEIQREELHCFLQLQNEKLRCTLKAIESRALYWMRQKEEDLARAMKKNMELEACLKKVEVENESCQRYAQAKESMVMDLSKRLEQVKESLVWVNNSAEDEESVFDGSCERAGQRESDNNNNNNNNNKTMACKHCDARSSCVVFLPCRHLCSCKSCEPFLVSCPVCKSVKEASINVFWV